MIVKSQWSHVLMAKYHYISIKSLLTRVSQWSLGRQETLEPTLHLTLTWNVSYHEISQRGMFSIYSYSICIYICIIYYRITVYVGICCQVYSYRCTTTDWWPMPKWYSSFCWQWVKSCCSCWQNLYRVLFHTPWLKALSHKCVSITYLYYNAI